MNKKTYQTNQGLLYPLLQVITLSGIIFLMLLTATDAHAHKITLDCRFEGSHLHGEVFYSHNNPARHCSVKCYSLNSNALLASGTTSDEGTFSFQLEQKVPLKVIADDGQGHRASWIWNGNDDANDRTENPKSNVSMEKIAAGLAVIIFSFGIIRFIRKHHHES